MKWWICLTALVLALTTSAAAADLPAELERAAPEPAEDLTGGDLSGGTGFAQGVGNILDRLADQVGDVVRERTRGAAAVLLVVVLCGVVEGFAQGTGGKGAAFLPMAGALSITLASAGSLDSLMGLGSRTIGELADFSQALLPTLAAATAGRRPRRSALRPITSTGRSTWPDSSRTWATPAPARRACTMWILWRKPPPSSPWARGPSASACCRTGSCASAARPT